MEGEQSGAYEGRTVVVRLLRGQWHYAVEAASEGEADQFGWLYPVPQVGASKPSDKEALGDAARFFPGATIVRGADA